MVSTGYCRRSRFCPLCVVLPYIPWKPTLTCPFFLHRNWLLSVSVSVSSFFFFFSLPLFLFIDILQPDITWVGGLTEARRIVNMASAYDIPVIPHGSSGKREISGGYETREELRCWDDEITSQAEENKTKAKQTGTRAIEISSSFF